ncbi:peptidase C14, caspase domain-containing protein [Chytridium lagenaria]|nr:peptidase C14, caspase domain-containing protein [Chytridium lagenaria]
MSKSERDRSPPRSSSASPTNKASRAPIRRAVLIGINYKGTGVELKGCIEDVRGVQQMLVTTLGYEDHPDTIRVNPKKMPNKKNILAAISWLRKDAIAGDKFYFHFSGHGNQQDSTDSYENLDETLVPMDYESAGQIVDNELNERLVFGLPKGVRMTCVFDCCHSGTILDLPYQYSADGKLLGPPNLTDKHKSLKNRSSAAEVILVSGCKDSQTAADASFNGVAKGALTHALLTMLRKNPGVNPSFLDILQFVRKEMKKNKFTQIPQLSASHEIDPAQKRFL